MGILILFVRLHRRRSKRGLATALEPNHNYGAMPELENAGDQHGLNGPAGVQRVEVDERPVYGADWGKQGFELPESVGGGR